MRRAPSFWWEGRKGWQARALSPLAWLYGAVAQHRMANGPRATVESPVICIGNLTAGGGGKTPTALAIAKAARQAGYAPGFLSRGHGGSLRAPTLVEAWRHDASEVGDEPLLLAGAGPAAVARDRLAGARLLIGAGCDFIVMDDGFQSQRLAADFSLVAVDAGRGLGNGAVIPAGPLRAPAEAQMRFADGVVVIGEGEGREAGVRAGARAGKPVFEARLHACGDPLAGERVLAFAGIARPGKFHETLAAMGARIVAARDFPDHHPFTPAEIEALLAEAAGAGLTLVTTRKDAVRLKGRGAAAERLLSAARVVDVELLFDPPETAARIVRHTLEAYRHRRFG
ncbi:tetraacyldisaccharide 4'-kinase [Aureimonas populi]|uniref:Tetraacyldisaccharide 4'-kinase n=1 Tax=Aureimonas populi TaxID=1701758 RepID=A0ABW5CHL9_9HYPH|nr:tetraacyldisaccharide 4'-kinase [Aureimonas populi]